MIDLAVQKAIRNRLVTTTAVTSIVPSSSILDRNQRPAPSPSIILGETQVVDAGSSMKREHHLVFHTIHIWQREASLQGVKEISATVGNALRAGRLSLDTGYHCADLKVASIRALRDPDGETSHCIITVEVLVDEVTA